ncbi:glycosyltransferase family 4 protein [Salinivibrio kushneri]|uniref:glycosyltransferase family 4 protein n=1 Tax=Salinivibrio kushneri TaxID=1908198 RepID=UPI0022B3A97A|nr:glycosyltransferase family 4 protein [Salinivibrio kushneri]WBA17148.1 glycosyltransferase family 4 protein [Salinivibrio kushneri]
MSHILFLVSSMQGGGAERVAALLSNCWAQQGHQVTLMPTFSGRGDCIYPLDERVKLDYLADRVSSRRVSLLNKFRRYAALRHAVREIAPDVVVSFLPHVNVAAIFAVSRLDIPVVVSERIYPPAMPVGAVLEWLRKWSYPKADTVVVQTIQAKRWLMKCCPNAHCQVIANPVVFPLPLGQPQRQPDMIVRKNRKLILAVGRLHEQKQFDLLMTAFSRLAESYPEWDLVILGEGHERECLEQKREYLGLLDRVYLPGRIGNLADWYDRAELFVMSSRFEGFPNTLLEAMAHGLPVVSFDCDAGPRDIIRQGVDGYLVPVESGNGGLSRVIEKLILDDSRRQKMSEASVAVRERFSMERVATQWSKALGLTETRDV